MNGSSQTPSPRPPIGRPLHHWFEAQAAATPAAVAVTFDGAGLTYAELNTRANQLAHHLRSLGVGPETLVGMCVERSLEMVIGILGVLKAGGAYVPLDLAYPKDRLAFILNDAAVPVLLTQAKLRDRLPAVAAQVVLLDAEWGTIARAGRDNPASGATPANLAYVIYTSGSTGQPKGVLVTHHNVERLFTATDHWYHFGPADVWTLFHSYAFDFSVWEIWGALLYGGRLVVVPYLVSRSPEAFYELLSRERVTVLNQTPSAFRQLIWAEASAPAPRELQLRYVIFGGEALELQSLMPWFKRHLDDAPQLINMYGITETTVHVTYRPIRLRDVVVGKGSVIGGPIDDLQVHVLDENLTPVPPGGTGEMFISGAGLARGYLNRPELTAQRFITGPTGARLYKSGDLARVLPGGDLEYLGRSDDQVKIRGFRIELGEIMAVLNRHPAVRDSVVIAAHGDGGDNRLLAYVVCRHAPPAIGELRTCLQQQLPEYMVPAGFLFLEQLPLTPNGKVDRRALPAPDRARPDLTAVFAAPQSAAEKILAAIWSEVLEVQPVGIDDNFFELGGDSIRVIQILARAQRRDLPLTLSQLFEEQTIRRLGHRLEQPSGAAVGAAPSAPFSLVTAADRERLPADLDDAYPMIKLQVGMFYHNELNPVSAVFHDVFSFRIQFPFVPAKLQQALQQYVLRHPTARTAFDLGGFSEPLQLVHKNVTVPFTVEDLRQATAEQQTQALTDWIGAEKYRPFDRSVAPLLRVHVQRDSDDRFQLVVSFHHVILDGWSLAAMLTEVLEDYSALINQTGKQIPAPTVPYREYVALERQTIADAACQQFWTQKLADANGQLLPRWPKSYCRGGTEQTRGPEIEISATVFEGLKRLANRAGTPLKSVLQAAHYRVLSLLHGTTDVISGAVTNGRPEEIDGERMIGLFLNTIPLRVNLSGGTWVDLVRRVFAAERELMPHRRMPLAEVQRLAGGQQLFETVFDFVHFHVYRNLAGYQDLGFMEGHYFEANNFTLYTTFMLDVTMTQLQMHFDYDPEVLCPPQIRALCDYYVNVLTAMAADPTARYDTFSPLSAPERQLLLTDWNATQADYARTALVDQLFEQQARQTPARIAVECAGQRLTYRELDQRAAQLAGHLRTRGVGPGKLVGVYVERSVAMVVALLAVLKAGGAYIPLDPIYPADRLAFMIDDAKPVVLLTQRELQTVLPPHAAQVVYVDAFDPAVAPAASHRQPTDPAYVIYTSGSTGKPKGVQIPHRAVVNFLTSMKCEPGITAADVLLAVTTLSFDIAGLELFLPLVNGARIVIASRETAADGVALAQLLAACGATVMQATPVTWRLLLQAGWDGSGTLKILCGGEALAPDLAEQLAPRGASVWNMYGPTETTIWSAVSRVQRGEPVVLGRPIANTDFYLVDDRLQPVPVGVPGELLIGGDGLALGYLNRPELTAARFIAHPFKPGARAYRTGDLARYRPDGALEFLGRLDQQVKIRGFRIELGEIETVLRTHPGVGEVVVLARADGPGGNQLVAYLTAATAPAPTVSELHQHLKQQLPEYMVPAWFVVLPALPRLPNGKVDRKALPAPGQTRPELAHAFVGPGTPTETVLAEIWAETLRIKQVGIHDRFFELGGDSILSIQVVARARRVGLILTLKQIFQLQTIAELALAATTLPPAQVEPGPVSGAVPLTPIQRWFFERDFADPHHWNQAMLLELRRAIDPTTIERALQQVVAHHDALRLQFRQEAHGWVQSLADAGAPVQLLRVDSIEELQDQLDLTRGPLVRAALIERGVERPQQLLIVIHHLVVDGVSWRILLDDLATACRGTQLPATGTSFGRWAQRLQAHAHEVVLQTELDHWLQVAPAGSSRLPVDRVGGDNVEASARVVAVALDPPATDALLHDVHQAYNTQINDVLLTALGIALTAWTEESAVLINMEGHGREAIFADVDLSRTVGWFTNLFPVRLELPGRLEPGAVLKSVKEQLRRIPRHGIGYGLLRYLNGAGPQLRALPQPVVAFNYLGQFDLTLAPEASFALVKAFPGPLHSPRARRSHVLEIVGWVAEGRLHFNWIYSGNVHERATIAGVAEAFVAALHALIAHCTAADAGGFTPSDFAEAGLDQEQLDRLVAEFNGAQGAES